MEVSAIRRDLFAVKEYDPTQGGWCFVRITRDYPTARMRARDIESNHSLGIRRQAKIVHPSQRMVDVFLLAGNRIE
jgi:hypothetical protein